MVMRAFVMGTLAFLVQDPPPERIAWYGTWERGFQVAKATGRPILLLAAAPQCHGISGLW